MASPPSRWLVLATSAVLVVIWGTTWSAIRLTLDGFAPFTSIAFRFALACLVLAAMARWAGARFWPRSPREWAIVSTQGILAYGVSYGFVYWAEQVVPSGLVALLFATMPLWVVLFAYGILPEERLGKFGVLGLLLGFVGLGVIFSDDIETFGGPEGLVAAALVLFSPVSAAVVQVVVKRWGKGLGAYGLTVTPLALAALVMTLLALVFEHDQPIDPAPVPVLALLYLAVLGTALTFGLYYWLLEFVSATHLSLITYLTPVVAVAIGTTWFDEPLTPRIVIGALCVLGGVGLVIGPFRSSGKKPPSADDAASVGETSNQAEP